MAGVWIDPTKRITASEALPHPYLDDLKIAPGTDGRAVPDWAIERFGDFSHEQIDDMTLSQARALIFDLINQVQKGLHLNQ